MKTIHADEEGRREIVGSDEIGSSAFVGAGAADVEEVYADAKYEVVFASGAQWRYNFYLDEPRYLVAEGSEGDMSFNQEGGGGPTTGTVASEMGPEAENVEEDVAQGLEPEMKAELDQAVPEVLAVIRRYGSSSAAFVREVPNESVAEAFDGALGGFGGHLRDRARDYLLDRLKGYEVEYLGESKTADVAVLEALAGMGRASLYRYEISLGELQFSRSRQRRFREGGRGRGGTSVRIGGGRMRVRLIANERMGIEGWTRDYLLGGGSIGASVGMTAAGGGSAVSSGGHLRWKTYQADSPSEWEQADFLRAWLIGAGLSLGHVEAEGVVTGVGRKAEFAFFKFETLALSIPMEKTLELKSEEKILEGEWKDPTLEGEIDVDPSDPISAGASAGAGIEERLERPLPMPGEDYSEETARDRPTHAREAATTMAPTRSASFEVGSSTFDQSEINELLDYFANYGHLVRDESVPFSVVGHASSLWRGAGDPSDSYHGETGNRELSRRRAENVAAEIHREFRLGGDRPSVLALGADVAHRQGHSSDDDQPDLRCVQVVLEGVRTYELHY